MEILFFVLALIALIAAAGVVLSRNAIHSALWLVVNLGVVAVFFATLEAHFLAVVQLIVYAGAIMVLVIFVLMLLNLKVEVSRGVSPVLVALVSVIGGVGFLVLIVPHLHAVFGASSESQMPALIEGTVQAIGLKLFTDYLFPFEAASVLLMAALVGAVWLSRREGGQRAEIAQR